MLPAEERTLYLSYFGLREPLVQTQVLPYLRQLGEGGIRSVLLTFEPERRRRWSPEQRREWSERLQAEGIRWLSLPYHKRPSLPATMLDIAVGAWTASRIVERHRIDVIHARGHVAAAMGTIARRISGGRLLFDIRGFMPEEYVDAGRWSEWGARYRLTKQAEKALLKEADGFVVLTQRARQILFPGCSDTDQRGRPIEVIPCCVDLERFRVREGVPRERLREEMGVTGRRVIVYLGALGGWYLAEEMAEFLSEAHRLDPATFSMILTQSSPELMTEPLRRHGIRDSDYRVWKAPPDQVPNYLRAADLAISFIKPSYSKLSSSPTKLAEYLAAGLPSICTAGIGDADQILLADRVGVLLPEMNRQAYALALSAAERLRHEPGIADRCRESARRHFDLKTIGGERYRRLYRRLLTGATTAPHVLGATR
jgi:glycosyltransferase involved in cell wall biosynthesis